MSSFATLFRAIVKSIESAADSARLVDQKELAAALTEVADRFNALIGFGDELGITVELPWELP